MSSQHGLSTTYLEGPLALEGDSLLAVTSGVEQEGGVALGLNQGVLILGTVHLGNDDAVNRGEALGQLDVDGCQRLAVTAPRSIDLE